MRSTSGPPGQPATSPSVASAPIVVDDNVWLAGQTVVLKGVRIGRNSVIGFRAVVTRDVPPDVIVAGNPAKVIRQLDQEPPAPAASAQP